MENTNIYKDIFYDIEEFAQIRLAEVQEQLSESIEQNTNDKIILNIASSCARETINILKHRDPENILEHVQYKEKIEVHALDMDAEMLALINCRIKKYNIPDFYTHLCSGGISNSYIWNKIPRADIVILGEVFTWMSLTDIEDTIKFLPQICNPGASIIWTKDLSSDFYGKPPTEKVEQYIRKFLKENNFLENFFLSEKEKKLSIGRYTYKGKIQDLIPDKIIFQYVEK